ncbi:hypothetical protein D3C75_1319750 [compost metagenome]
MTALAGRALNSYVIVRYGADTALGDRQKKATSDINLKPPTAHGVKKRIDYFVIYVTT